MKLNKTTSFRKVIDPDGTFQIQIPPTWRYWVMEERVHCFEDNEVGSGEDCFQFSLMLLTEIERTELAETLGYLPSTAVGDFDCRQHNDSSNDGLVTKAWSTICGYYHVYFTFTYAPHYKKEYRRIELENKLKVVFSAFSTFDILPEEQREQLVTSHRFQVFLQGIGAANLLAKKAIGNKAFFETICLFSNQIDSLLRIAIILKQQLLNNNDIIDREWIYQGQNDKKKSEKDVYKKALSLDTIDQDIYNYLFELYEDRNRVIHRFIISEITLAEVECIAHKYYFLREDMKVMVDNLETEQVKLGIGMTITNENDPGTDHLICWIF